jgi:hypothetical protein
MSTPQPTPTAAEAGNDTVSPNQYRLHGARVRINYFPRGGGPLTADGPIMLVYQDSHRSLAFRGRQADVVPVADFGTCVTVTIETMGDAEWRTATLLVPTVVLIPGRPAKIKTVVINAVHSLGLAGVGHPQRTTYRVTTLTGEASLGPLPL